MGRRCTVFIIALAVALLAACSTGPARRISRPAASIQQLAVQTDGSWTLSLRLQNYSSVAMRFDSLELELSVDGQAAGTLSDSPALEISPESADIVEVALQPDPVARMLLADALAGGRGVGYELTGSIGATPVDRGSRQDYDIKRKSALSPAPGLPGVLR